MIVVNAHDITRTVLCEAAGCEHDASHRHALCESCQRKQRSGQRVVIHRAEPGPTMRNCSICGEATHVRRLVAARCRSCVNVGKRERRRAGR